MKKIKKFVIILINRVKDEERDYIFQVTLIYTKA